MGLHKAIHVRMFLNYDQPLLGHMKDVEAADWPNKKISLRSKVTKFADLSMLVALLPILAEQ